MADELNDRSIIKLFGFELKRSAKSTEEKKNLPSIVPPTDEDGAGYVTAAGTYMGQYINLDGNESKNNAQLIRKYRGVAQHPEVDAAIEDIVNEAISTSELKSSVEINLDKVELSDGVKKKIVDEFDFIATLLKFNELGHDIFRRWYVDGRIYHHLVVADTNLKLGIRDIRPIDAAKIRKVKEVQAKKDPVTGAKIIVKVDEYFIYQEKPGVQNSGVKLSKDSVSYVTSGLLDSDRKKVISYLHKALKPVNQLRMMENALVIYRLARAPERRIFYIDVGNLPRGKAEAYMTDIMAKYRNKLVYDATTGEIKDDRKHMSMLEDFWLPRREGGRGTEISTLPGGENLGQIDDIVYMQKNLYKSLNVPVSRLEQETPFNLGRSTEITREELKFQKFIDRLRSRFQTLFLDILRKHLVMKNIITEEDWENIINDVQVDFIKDTVWAELKETEVLRERLQSLEQSEPYVGVYFSKEWIMKTVLRMSDADIEEMKKQMKKELDGGELEDDEEIKQMRSSMPQEEPEDEKEDKPKPEKTDPKPKDEKKEAENEKKADKS